jgi:dihydroxyacetone kinase DhaKLM complex PTS-EIIA-like component DhaM
MGLSEVSSCIGRGVEAMSERRDMSVILAVIGGILIGRYGGTHGWSICKVILLSLAWAVVLVFLDIGTALLFVRYTVPNG